MTMTGRHRRILASLVAEYIEQGEPVSSAWLADHSTLGLSSATVRHILAALEEQGFVRQPHTSAGRVPTDSGYRLYVDSILESRRRVRPLVDIEARLRRVGTIDGVFAHASHELSRASQQIGFAFAPASTTVRLQHIDFAALDGTRVLVIVVAAGGHVIQTVIETDEAYSPSALTQAANYLNTEFSGLTLQEAREAIVSRLREERLLYDALMRRALTLAQRGLEHVQPEERLHVQGAAFLFDGLSGESADRESMVEALRVLFRMIEEKHQLVELLNRSIEASGLTVIIGSEHASRELYAFSLVASTFPDGDRTATIGVIGPTRMRYQRAISAVDSLSQAVSRVLESQ
jgi:heat-inducible transcriptional repressor